MTETNLAASHQFESHGKFRLTAPAEIRWALKLLWLSLAISLAQYLYFLYFTAGAVPVRRSTILSFVISISVYIFGAYLNVGIAHRKNWARFVKLIFALGSLIILKMTVSPGRTALEYFIVGVAPSLSFAALYLLFFTSGRLWFRQSSSDIVA